MDPEHSISAAKQYDPDGLHKTRLKNAPDVSRAFDHAGLNEPGVRADIDSQQVRDSGAQHNMRPTPEIADGPDRAAHEAGMAKDDLAVELAHLDMLMQRVQERLKSRSHTQNHGHGIG